MQESDKVANAAHVQNEVKQDAFRVGDVVWDVVFGKGSVYKISEMADYSIKVKFENRFERSFTPDGKIHEVSNRTLFFSEPKIEASVTRPFVPTLVGKRVVVVPKFDREVSRLFTVFKEDSERIYVTEEGHYWDKDKIDELYEVQSENLLTSKK